MLLWGHLLRFGKQSTDAVFIIASRDHTRNRDQVPPVGELRAAQQGAQGTLRAQLHVAWVVPQVGRGRVSENLLGRVDYVIQFDDVSTMAVLCPHIERGKAHQRNNGYH